MFRIGPQNYDFNPEIKWQISARSKLYRFVTYHENWTRYEIMNSVHVGDDFRDFNLDFDLGIFFEITLIIHES